MIDKFIVSNIDTPSMHHFHNIGSWQYINITYMKLSYTARIE
jgi:hypothetical protein